MKTHRRRILLEPPDVLVDGLRPVTPEELAEALGDLRYDGLAEYLAALATKFRGDAEADRQRGRDRLATNLFYAAHFLEATVSEVQLAWRICEPRMTEGTGISNTREKRGL